MDLCNLKDIQSLPNRHGFHFSKAMGQNFLIDAAVPQAIAEGCGADESCAVLEIGPGIGCLTAQLARRAGKVAAVELDKRLPPVLEETLAEYDNVHVISGDILKLDIPALVQEEFGTLRPLVCANLPYNITTPVLSALIDSGCFESLTVMIQKEVAQRICAAPGTGDYGAFSVYMQFHTEPEILFDVPPHCFTPQPKVTSAVLRCRVRRAPRWTCAMRTSFSAWCALPLPCGAKPSSTAFPPPLAAGCPRPPWRSSCAPAASAAPCAAKRWAWKNFPTCPTLCTTLCSTDGPH